MKKTLRIYSFILLFIVHCTLNIDNCMCQWFKLPDLPVNGTMYDMYFVNANTGWITFLSPNSLIKTTNGGLNWIIQSNNEIRNIQFIDSLLGYANGYVGSTSRIWKTTDGGSNWSSLFVTGNGYADIFFVNKDTGWTCGGDGNQLGVWRTIDGGYSWIRQLATTYASNLDRIFFLKNKVNGEYWGWTLKSVGLWRTTNSGVNWVQLNNIGGCNSSDGVDMYFKDTSNGIITRRFICFSTTTNGGINWTHHIDNGFISAKIGIGDNNKLWLTMGTKDTLIITNNFFQTYGRQVTASSTGVIFALDTSTVFAGWDWKNMQKTTNGGGPIIYSGVDSLFSIIPENFKLCQNYPNPFNPVTRINYELPKGSKISLIIYDLLGRELKRLVDNEYKPAGLYSIDFNEPSLASGVYYYKITASDSHGEKSYEQVKKMIYIK
jgi:photosystem II stability/assembly factor-like uncharacterized protein